MATTHGIAAPTTLRQYLAAQAAIHLPPHFDELSSCTSEASNHSTSISNASGLQEPNDDVDIDDAAHALRRDLHRSWLETRLTPAAWRAYAFHQRVGSFIRWPQLADRLREDLGITPGASVIPHILDYYDSPRPSDDGADSAPIPPQGAGEPLGLFSFGGHHWFTAQAPFEPDEDGSQPNQHAFPEGWT